MGQKVNPVGFRLLNSKNWESVWFDQKNYAKKLINDVTIRSFIKKNYAHCGIGSVVIERPSDKIHLIIKTSKPVEACQSHPDSCKRAPNSSALAPRRHTDVHKSERRRPLIQRRQKATIRPRRDSCKA